MTARRQVYHYRMAVSAADKTELIDKLSRSPSTQVATKASEIAFVFSGQGGQYLGMGRSLYRTCSTFRHIIDQCHSILVDLGFSGILHVIDEVDSGENLEPEYECFQTAIVALQYALARLWMTWGLSPRLIIGIR
jgi:acyl transferase domain-containing protein